MQAHNNKGGYAVKSNTVTTIFDKKSRFRQKFFAVLYKYVMMVSGAADPGHHEHLYKLLKGRTTMMKKLTRLILPLLACLLLSGLLPTLLPNIAGAAEKTYTITQGTDPAYVSNVEIDKTKAAAGEPVTVRILDPSHYSCVVQSCSYADSAGSVTYLLSDADDAPPARDCVITFPMPAKNITVTVGFEKRRTVPQEYLANRDSREYLRMDKVYTKPNTKVNLYVTEPYRKELETIRLEKIVNGRYSHWYDIPGVPGTNVPRADPAAAVQMTMPPTRPPRRKTVRPAVRSIRFPFRTAASRPTRKRPNSPRYSTDSR